MRKEDILTELRILDELNVSRERYAITYSGALVMNGIIEETQDIDISVDVTVKDYLEVIGYKFSEFDNGKKKGWKLSLSDKLDLHTHDTLMTPIVTEMVDGYLVQTTDSVLIEKFVRGREKDLKSIQLILNQCPEKHMLMLFQ